MSERQKSNTTYLVRTKASICGGQRQPQALGMYLPSTLPSQKQNQAVHSLHRCPKSCPMGAIFPHCMVSGCSDGFQYALELAGLIYKPELSNSISWAPCCCKCLSSDTKFNFGHNVIKTKPMNSHVDSSSTKRGGRREGKWERGRERRRKWKKGGRER